MRVIIGHDPREQRAYDVAAHSLWRSSHLRAEPLVEQDLRDRGIFTRPVDRRDGRIYDILSGVDQSTAFALTRFLVPILFNGWVLFTDCDVVFLEDVGTLVGDPTKAVHVVKHAPRPFVDPTKMDGQVQRDYPRKNWSSVILWNCDHPANRRLTLHDVNTRHRDYLHGFGWLNGNEIGELAPRWNWLIGVEPEPQLPAIAHFTLGGPWLDNWKTREHDDLWQYAHERLLADQAFERYP